MKRKIKATIVVLVALVASNTFAQNSKTIKTGESTVNWKANKVTGSHEGTINFKEGALTFDGETLTGGTLTVDMTSINVTDLQAGKGKEKLEGHLHSEDFFGTANHGTATLVIKEAKKTEDGNYTATGDLTTKGATNPITFNLTPSEGGMNTSVKVDRTKYDIKYGSGSFFDNLGDKAINDEFTLDVVLKY